MPHDGYLKLWQLKKPILKNIPDCRHDVLMIDEGQDMNPAMLEIFNYQKTTKTNAPHQCFDMQSLENNMNTHHQAWKKQKL